MRDPEVVNIRNDLYGARPTGAICHAQQSFPFTVIITAPKHKLYIIFTVAPRISKIHLSLHTNKRTKLIYYLNSVLIIHIKTLYLFVTPTCFDTLCVTIREHTFFLAKITD
jgi:hypothetical protein